MATVVDIVDADDYIGIYFDEKLVYHESRYISAADVFKLCENLVIDFRGTWECSLEWIDEVGAMPKKLEDVKVSHMGKEIPIHEYWETL